MKLTITGGLLEHIRDALVRQARPQKSWPMVEMARTALNADVDSAELKISSDEPAP